MYIFNITFVVEPSAEAKWGEILEREFIPQLGDCRTVFCRVLSEHHTGHYTFSLQVDCQTIGDYQAVNEKLQEVWGDKYKATFGEQVLYFATLMKRLN